MNTYVMTEKLNPQSTRYSVTFKAKNLTLAKRKATSLQCFERTILEICNSHGETLAVKDWDGTWVKQSFFNS